MYQGIAIGIPFSKDAIPYGYMIVVDSLGNIVQDSLGRTIIAKI